jgi:diguanylate cyclase (GGDEF)-like protein
VVDESVVVSGRETDAGMLLVDRQGWVRQIDEQVCRHLRLEYEAVSRQCQKRQLHWRDFFTLYVEGEDLALNFNELIHAEVPIEHLEVELHSEGGLPLWVELSVWSVTSFDDDALALVSVSDVSGRYLIDDRLKRLTSSDTLTGLASRSCFVGHCREMVGKATEAKAQFGLILLDLSNLGEVNASCGNAIGDIFLRACAERLLSCIGGTTIGARIGGDTLAILPLYMLGLDELTHLAEKVMRSFAPPLRVDSTDLECILSVGAVLFPDDGLDEDSLLRHAEVAMYAAKRAGSGQLRFYSPDMDAQVFVDVEVRSQLRHALEQGRLEVRYQPRASVSTGQIVSLEAMVQWRNEEGVLVPPVVFRQIADKTGLAVQIGQWALRKILSDMNELDREGFPIMTVTMTLSGLQFRNLRMISDFRSIFARAPGLACLIEFQISEADITRDVDYALTIFSAMKGLGVRLSISDFVTGHISPYYAQQLQVDTVKLDRSFVKGVDSDHGRFLILSAIMKMAMSLHVSVVIDGVETRAELDVLKNVGAHEYQGVLLGRPLLLSKLRMFLRRNLVGRKDFGPSDESFEADLHATP